MSKKHSKEKKYNITIITIIIVIIVGSIFLYTIKNQNSLNKYKNNPNAAKTIEPEIQKLMDIQFNNGPMALLKVDCNELSTTNAIEYCKTRQEILQNINISK